MIEAVLKDKEPDFLRRGCRDCRHCKGAISWWCTNKNAIKERGTPEPVSENCKFWIPARRFSDLSWFERTFGNHILI